ncbi:MAG: flagellin, partial [Phycisphaera sp.]|nr:flagellin [Phycisphaera sp.]
FNSGISDITVNSIKLSDSGAARSVTVTVTQSAQRAAVALSTGATFLNGGSGAVTFEIAGERGSQLFTFASGTTIANVAAAINDFSEALGATASVSGSVVAIRSTNFGSDQFLRVREVANANASRSYIRQVNDAGALTGTASDDIKDFGRDARVNINGVVATARGLNARVALDGFDVSVSLRGTGSGTINTVGGSRTFQITGGGADFNLSPDVNLAGKVSLGIETVSSSNLGNAALGYLSELKSGGTANVENGNLTKAQEILDAATKQVSSIRGRLGAFTKNVVGSTVNSLSVALENTMAAESAIRDTDFAAETAAMTRNQILVQASTQALALSNSAPQSVLSLMR